nr:methyl-accepting chemotaxis protein [Paenibacillus soyae]
MIIGIIVSLCLSISIIVYIEITQGIKETATEKAKGDLELSYSYIDTTYPGEWHIQDDQLYKGTELMNGNDGIVDKIAADTQDTVTIFQGDTRIATNVMKEGKRAVGTQASAEVQEQVLTRGELFYGEANVAGHLYQSAYMPLKNGNGDIIGMYYVGASQHMIDKIIDRFVATLIPIVAAIILIAGFIGYWFTRMLKKRLNRIVVALDRAGNGDFTAYVEDRSSDELNQLSASFNRMADRLKHLVNEVILNSQQVAASSEQLSASAEQTGKATETITESIQEVADGAEQSSSKMKESSIAIEEVTRGVQSIAESASFISELSIQASEKANDGEELVERSVKQMSFISESANTSDQLIKSLEQRSSEIGEISTVISGIAEQTNLLALNAAIEAARAGEHGKGFAVVAGEVKKLAEQSRQSSSQISELVRTIQVDMIRSQQSMGQVLVDVKEGIHVAHQTEASFKEILELMGKLSEHIHGMAAVSQQVSASTQEIDSTVAGITQISAAASNRSQDVAAAAEEQLASMEEITASAQSLSKLADDLHEITSKFKV